VGLREGESERLAVVGRGAHRMISGRPVMLEFDALRCFADCELLLGF